VEKAGSLDIAETGGDTWTKRYQKRLKLASGLGLAKTVNNLGGKRGEITVAKVAITKKPKGEKTS